MKDECQSLVAELQALLDTKVLQILQLVCKCNSFILCAKKQLINTDMHLYYLFNLFIQNF